MIFLDTGFLYALFSEDDEHHLRVREVFEQYRDRRLSDFLVTTNLVIGETITLTRNRGPADPDVRHDRAVKIGR